MKLKYAKMHGVLAAILGGLSLFLIPSAVAAVADGATLDERIRKYVIDLGFTEGDIEKMRTILLEEK